MKRRSFLKAIPIGFTPTVINGFGINALGPNPILSALSNLYTETDHVLVLIQMTGGNDGLNMVIPLDQYGNLSNARSNILIDESKVLKLTNYPETGLHPAMTGMHQLFEEGELAIVQGVSYPDPNFSHFRATDIWLTGSDADEILISGWAGRYLGNEYVNYPIDYPNDIMPDPLAIQIGSVLSPAFQSASANTAFAISSTSAFYNLVNGVNDPAPDTPAGKELTYIRTVALQTKAYVDVVSAAANNVTSQSPSWPTAGTNKFADQLKIVSQLIAGGLKTRIYLVSQGSYDTHSDQVDTTDTSTGNHANLLGQLSEAVKAFCDDTKYLGTQDRVIGMTFSEFGRRIGSNGSAGTDHGAAAPLFVFGSKVASGIVGQNPTIPVVVTGQDNVPMQYDFRSVYASILQNWFCVPKPELEAILLKDFQTLPILQDTCTSTNTHQLNQLAGASLISNYPNPFTEITNIKFESQGGHVSVQISDLTGRVIKTLIDEEYAKGAYQKYWNSDNNPPGNYYLRLQNGPIQQVKLMIKM